MDLCDTIITLSILLHIIIAIYLYIVMPWNSTLDRNDVPLAWLYGQDHLWETQDLVCSPGEL